VARIREAEGTEGSEALPRLRPGRHGLPREFVAENQRGRIAAGMIATVADYGYEEATMGRICGAAGVSSRTFYELFDSKQACFAATYEMIAAHLRESAWEASAEERSWPDRVRARIGAALEVFAANPDLARFTLAAPPRAGASIAARFHIAMEETLEALTEDLPKDLASRRPSRNAEHALLGGGVALIVAKVEAGEGECLPELLPDLTELALTPYLGRGEAARIAAGRRPAGD
jgi:AcrR family transcriptional regulator